MLLQIRRHAASHYSQTNESNFHLCFFHQAAVTSSGSFSFFPSISAISTGGPRLRASDPDPNKEDQDSSDNHLKCGAEKGRIHIPLSDPANEKEFNCHDPNGNRRRSSKFWNQIWQRVTDSARCGH